MLFYLLFLYDNPPRWADGGGFKELQVFAFTQKSVSPCVGVFVFSPVRWRNYQSEA